MLISLLELQGNLTNLRFENTSVKHLQALVGLKNLMRGSVRTGTADAEIIEEAFLLRNDIRNVEIIDVSAGKEERGFDIVGHHY